MASGRFAELRRFGCNAEGALPEFLGSCYSFPALLLRGVLRAIVTGCGVLRGSV